MKIAMNDLRFLNKVQYIDTLLSAAKKAMPGERFVLATMDIDPLEPKVTTLLDALQAAAHRGVQVTLLVDAHNFLQHDNMVPGPMFYRTQPKNYRGKFDAIWRMLQELAAAGGNFCITNVPKRRFQPAPLGRSHIKGAVVGDQVFVGGCNLEHLEYIDLMVTWHDKCAADVLAGWLLAIGEAGQTRDAFSDVDTETMLDPLTSLMLDAGVPGQSLIYDEALLFIDAAQEWLFMTCQYFPGGPTATALARAQARGVRVELHYSHPRAHTGTARLIHQAHQVTKALTGASRQFRTSRLPASLPKLHAKVLASEHGAFVGSHNYVQQGVNFGTAELALHSTDPTFANNIRNFLQQRLKSVT